MPPNWAFLVTGLVAGVASGLFGIGGGLIIVPVLTLGFGMSQHEANGTSLVALLLPVGAFAVWTYWKSGRIGAEHIQSGLWIALGLGLGAFLGSNFALSISPTALRRAFSVFLLIAAIKLGLA